MNTSEKLNQMYYDELRAIRNNEALSSDVKQERINACGIAASTTTLFYIADLLEQVVKRLDDMTS